MRIPPNNPPCLGSKGCQKFCFLQNYNLGLNLLSQWGKGSLLGHMTKASYIPRYDLHEERLKEPFYPLVLFWFWEVPLFEVVILWGGPPSKVAWVPLAITSSLSLFLWFWLECLLGLLSIPISKCALLWFLVRCLDEARGSTIFLSWWGILSSISNWSCSWLFNVLGMLLDQSPLVSLCL